MLSWRDTSSILEINGDEMIQSYVADLRILASTCEYGQLNDEFIRDRIVCGIFSDRVRKQLLKERDLNLNRAIHICQVNELSEKHNRELSQAESSKCEEVNSLKCKKPVKKHISNCRNCGRDHVANKSACPAFGKQCHACKKLNHFKSVCRSFTKNQHKEKTRSGKQFSKFNKSVNELATDQHESDDDDMFFIESIDADPSRKEEIHCTATVNNCDVKLKLDTGAKCNVLTFNLFKELRKKEKINKSKVTQLVAYGGDMISTMGTVVFNCKIGSREMSVEFHVVNKPVTSLLGLKSSLQFNLIKLDSMVHEISEETVHDDFILKQNADLFDEDVLGELPVQYKMRLDPSVVPVIKPARKIPYALQDSVKEELEKMVQKGVITPVTDPTEWVSQMVAKRKKNGEIRICIDPRDLNKALLRSHHPMRTAEDVASRISNATLFSKLDAKSGFWQIKLDERSSHLTTFSSPYGRYRFLRMPFGISAASEIFQHTMEQLFAGYPCEIIVDDILVWGNGREEHDSNLAKVLQRAREVGLQLNLKKCQFRVKSVSYVGHQFTEHGLKPDTSKVKAITEMPPPEDQAALQRFLGMLNYLSKYIENYSEKTSILRALLHKDVHWFWDKPQQDAFDQLKKEISNPPVLKYFDVHKPVTLSVDASQNGIGAVCMQDGSPVAYASRALTQTESQYAQIEKELLAAVFACSKFHDFIFGNTATIETDHKPLITIVKKPLHQAPARLQRMLLQLQRYDLHFVYKRGKELYIADLLSRAYTDEQPNPESSEEFEVMSVKTISTSRMDELRNATSVDPTMQKLVSTIKSGWPEKYKHVPPEIKPYYHVRDELIVDDGIVLRNHRMVVPQSLRKTYLEQLHRGHPGIEATKKRARDIVYWPTLSQDIDNAVSSCQPCNSTKQHQQREPLRSYEVPDLPWSTVASDLFEWCNIHYIVLVDSYSGWFELDSLRDTTTKSVVKKLKRHFAAYGIPERLVTDNGPQFVSNEFKSFSKTWNFNHVTSSPNYPQSNGLAENAVKQAKLLLEKCKRDGSDPLLGLLNLRNTPRSNAGSPAQRFLARRTCTTIPVAKKLLTPKAVPTTDVTKSIKKRRTQQARCYNKRSKPLPILKPSDIVRIQTDKGFNKLAVVKSRAQEPRSYIVQSDGKRYRRNRKHLLKVREKPEEEDSSSEAPEVPEQTETSQSTSQPLQESPDQESPDQELPDQSPTDRTDRPTVSLNSECLPQPIITRSGRVSKPNPKYKDFVC